MQGVAPLALVALLAAGCGGTYPVTASVSSVEKAFAAEGVTLQTPSSLPKTTTLSGGPCPKGYDCGIATITVRLHKVAAPRPLAVLFAVQRRDNASVSVWIYRTAADARIARAAFRHAPLNAGTYLVHDNVMVGYVLIPRSATGWFNHVRRALARA